MQQLPLILLLVTNAFSQNRKSASGSRSIKDGLVENTPFDVISSMSPSVYRLSANDFTG